MAKKNLRNAKRREEEKREFEEEVLQIDRVTRVVKGGRRLRFRCTVTIGDKKGRVGIGIGKAGEVMDGIKKAVAKAKANLITIPITKDGTIPHAIELKYKAARLRILPASLGTGVIAGGALRNILKMAGVENALAKSYGTTSKIVVAQASIKALQTLRPLKDFMKKQGKQEEVKMNNVNKKIEHDDASAQNVSRHTTRVEKKVEKNEIKKEQHTPSQAHQEPSVPAVNEELKNQETATDQA